MRRVGVIVPSNNVVIEPEFYSSQIRSCTFHFTRIHVKSMETSDYVDMVAQVERALPELQSAGVDMVVYACLSTSFVFSRQWESDFVSQVRETMGVPGVTAAQAVCWALRTRSVTRLGLVSPYSAQLSTLGQEYFAGEGFHVVGCARLDVPDMAALGQLSPDRLLAAADELRPLPLDGVAFLSTDVPTADPVARFEKAYARPAVGTNAALLEWIAHAGESSEMRR